MDAGRLPKGAARFLLGKFAKRRKIILYSYNAGLCFVCCVHNLNLGINVSINILSEVKCIENIVDTRLTGTAEEIKWSGTTPIILFSLSHIDLK